VVIVEIGSPFFAQASLYCKPSFSFSTVTGVTGTHHPAQLLVEMKSC
jgi:hypothetical protein